jgi:putative ABC transport system permease protein
MGYDLLSVPVAGGGMATATQLLTEQEVLAHRATGWRVGQSITLEPGSRTVRVAGLYGKGDDDAQAHLLFADIATAQEVLGKGGQLTRIGVALTQTDPWRSWLDQLFPGVGSQLATEDTQVIGADLTLHPMAFGRVEQRFTNAILFNIGALSMMSAVVAMFLMYQSGVSSLRRRALLFVRLRGIGYTDRMLLVYVLTEGVLLCGVSSVIGISLGLFLGEWLIGLTQGGVDTFATVAAAPALTPWVIGKGLAFGLGIGVASMGLAYRAVRPEHDRFNLCRWWLTAGCLSGVVILGLVGDHQGLLGPFIALAALSFLVALCVRPAALGLSRLLLGCGARQVQVLINLKEIRHYIGDIQVALGALLIAVATALGIGVMVDSFRASFTEMLALRLEGDWFVQKEGEWFSSTDVQFLRDHPAVASLQTYGEQTAWVSHESVRERVTVGYYSELDAAVRRRYGFDRSIRSGEVMVSEPLAMRFAVSVGDHIQLRAERGSTALRVVHIFRDYGRSSPRVLLDQRAAQTLLGRAPVDRAFIIVNPNRERDALVSLATERGWQIQSQSRIRTLALNVFDRTFVVTDALTAVGLIVAVMGLYNAITALQLKRDREFRLLQAIGFTARDLMRMSVVQSVWLAGIALLLALPLGLAIAWMLCDQINPRAFGWSIPLRPGIAAMAKPMIFGFIVAPLAGWLPALRWVGRHAKGQHAIRQYDE